MAQETRINFANELRGIAALCVVFSHFCGVFWNIRAIPHDLTNTPILSESAVASPALAHFVKALPIDFGAFGVGLFFLISGFVIPFSLSRLRVPAFLVARCLRIYPLYWVGLTVSISALYLSGRWAGNPFPYSLFQAACHYLPGIRNLLGTPSIDGIVWTLEIEVKFYIVAACLAPLIRAMRLRVFAVIAILAFVVARFHGYVFGSIAQQLAFESLYMIFMFVGVAFHYTFRAQHDRRLMVAIVVSSFAAFELAAFLGDASRATIISYLFAFIVFAAAFLASSHWPRTRLLSFFADISYPLYVSHAVAGYSIMLAVVRLGGQSRRGDGSGLRVRSPDRVASAYGR